MIYSFSLQQVALVVGAFYFIANLFAALRPVDAAVWLRALPRSVPAGLVLMGVAVVWSLWLCVNIDLGEFTPMRTWLILICLALGGAMLVYSREYLAVRAIAVLLLLAANIVLDAAFLRDEPAKLVLVVLAYVWIVAGIVFLFSPYLLRDLIGWWTKTPRCSRIGGIAGAVFGLVLMVLGFVAY